MGYVQFYVNFVSEILPDPKTGRYSQTRRQGYENTILCGKDVRKTFTQGGKETQILLGIDVNIYEGDFTVIMGASGAGKSTLLYLSAT